MNKRRILIVDDEPIFIRLLKLNLERTGQFTVKEEPDARKALESALEFQPDLILLDMVMPKTDGTRVAAQLRSHPALAEIPIIFLTASISTEGKRPTQEVLGCRALAKPIGLKELVEAIDEQLAGAVGAH
jgi:CheY-like chemotaxis protein